MPFDPFGFGANYLGEVVTLEGADGRTVTGQGILDYDGTYPARSRHAPRDSRSSGRPRSRRRATWRFRPAADSSTRRATAIPMPTRRPPATTVVRSSRRARRSSIALHRRRYRRRAQRNISRRDHAEAVGGRITAESSTEQLGETKVTLNIGKGIKAPNVYRGRTRSTRSSTELRQVRTLTRSVPRRVAASTSASSRRSLRAVSARGSATSTTRSRACSSFEPHTAGCRRRAAGRGCGHLVWRLHQFRIVRCAGCRALCRRRARGRRAFQRVVHVPGRRGHRSVRPKRRIQSGVSHDPDWRFSPLVGARPFRRPANSGTLFVGYTAGPWPQRCRLTSQARVTTARS